MRNLEKKHLIYYAFGKETNDRSFKYYILDGVGSRIVSLNTFKVSDKIILVRDEIYLSFTAIVEIKNKLLYGE